MEERKGVSPPTNIGISLLLVVFLILCLFTFSAIALVQAGNESKNSETTAESRSEYYAAVNEAELSLYKKNKSLNQNPAPKIDISETFPINDSTTLKVHYKLTRFGEDRRYVMTQCKSIPSKEWVGDDSVNIIR